MAGAGASRNSQSRRVHLCREHGGRHRRRFAELLLFSFLPWLGVRGTALETALLNLAAAGMALMLSRVDSASVRTAPPTKMDDPSFVASRKAFALYVIAGGIFTPSDRLADLLLITHGGGTLIF